MEKPRSIFDIAMPKSQVIVPVTAPPPPPPKKSKKWLPVTILLLLLLIAGGAAAYFFYFKKDKPVNDGTSLVAPEVTETEPLVEPELVTEDIISGYSNIWDLVFVESDIAVFDERNGKLHGFKLSTKEKWEIATVPNVRSEGEGGLMGLALDTEFKTNNYMYACYNATGATKVVKIARFKLAPDKKSASEFTDIVSDIQSQGGRHSGCRMAMDSSKHLWVGTGDSAIGTAPQDPKSLAGKVLRVDRDGKGVTGNAAAPFDNRIYNYGHRNIQGLLLLKQPLENGAIGITSEHGPDKQDEVNWLMQGNFGWNPDGSGNAYDESVPMTDKTAYPDAVDAIWNSGSSTIAVSGMTFLTHEHWSLWKNWVAVAALKGSHVHLLQINAGGAVPSEKEILKDFGRLRAAVEGPDGALYITTDNGSGKDKIVRAAPK